VSCLHNQWIAVVLLVVFVWYVQWRALSVLFKLSDTAEKLIVNNIYTMNQGPEFTEHR